MRYLSVCSGIEAASAAWEYLGWKPVGFSEIEPFPCAVLSHRFPCVPNFGDMTKYSDWSVRPGDFDLLVGGTPCQAFSVAGLRKGLNDPRGNLTLVFLGMIAHFKPKFVVWENVPGVISDGTGAFDSFLQGLNGIGYVFDADILDAQFFGVPQRRRRVFVVAIRADYVNENFDIGVDYERPADGELFSVKDLLHGEPDRLGQAADKIKFVVGAACAGRRGTAQVPPFPAGVRGNLTEGCVEGKDCASGAFGRAEGSSGIAVAIQENMRGELRESDTFYSLSCSGGKPGQGYQCVLFRTCPNDSRIAECTDTMPARRGTGGVSTPLTVKHGEPIAIEGNGTRPSHKGIGVSGSGVMYTLNATEVHGVCASAVRFGNVIRRLTPVECERLQGFPDDWTKIPWKGKPAISCPDSPRYKALGNSMAVPVMRYVGVRIQFLDDALCAYRKCI